MIGYLIKKILGSRNERAVRKLWPLVDQINTAEQQLLAAPEEALRQKTAAWKEKLSAITDPVALKQELELILPEIGRAHV